jgi:seryl-tRNA synthetase
MFEFCDANNSNSEFEKLVEIQKKLYSKLNIPYRVLEMPTEELGASASRKIDIEAYLPGKKSFGEISRYKNI